MVISKSLPSGLHVDFTLKRAEFGEKMRADRLLSLMMLLQTRQQMTAAELADELEVSKRTIYRDIDALSAVGVPIYANGGPGGGYALLDSYRTTLTRLSEDEMQALFMLTIPSPIADLGISQQLKAAILKLTSAFSEPQQDQATNIRQRLHLDAARWFQPDEPTPHLKGVQEAVWLDRQLHLTYRRRNGTVSQRTVLPYGLVAKAGIWYLVAATDNGIHVYRVSRIEAVEFTQSHFGRSQDFDLADFWTNWVTEYETSLPKYPVTLAIGPDLISTLPYILGQSAQSRIDQAKPDTNGWRVLNYTFERMEEARMVVLGMGASAEVIAPEELRVSVLKFAMDIVALQSVPKCV